MKNRLENTKQTLDTANSHNKLNKTSSYLFNANNRISHVGGGVGAGVSNRLFPCNRARSTSPMDFTTKRQIFNDYLTQNIINDSDISQHDRYSKRPTIVRYNSVSTNKDISPRKNETDETTIRQHQKKISENLLNKNNS